MGSWQSDITRLFGQSTRLDRYNVCLLVWNSWRAGVLITVWTSRCTNKHKWTVRRRQTRDCLPTIVYNRRPFGYSPTHPFCALEPHPSTLFVLSCEPIVFVEGVSAIDINLVNVKAVSDCQSWPASERQCLTIGWSTKSLYFTLVGVYLFCIRNSLLTDIYIAMKYLSFVDLFDTLYCHRCHQCW